jgi:Zn-dependent protease
MGSLPLELQVAMIIALIISVILHEMAHGYAANWLGDPTARLAGRLTANPIPHIDPLMSVILPGLLIVTSSPVIFGAAKPVPYNPYNLRDQKWGEAIVAAAGPATNIFIAIVFALLIRAESLLGLSGTFVQLSFMIIMLNIFLAIFNLIPIPPLDGSKILPRFLPLTLAVKYEGVRRTMEQNAGLGFVIVILLFVFVLAQPLYALTITLATFLTGI